MKIALFATIWHQTVHKKFRKKEKQCNIMYVNIYVR